MTVTAWLPLGVFGVVHVVVVGIAERSGHHISFRQFSRYGLVVTAVTILVAAFYVWLCCFVMGWT